jgi:phage shock protein E
MLRVLGLLCAFCMASCTSVLRAEEQHTQDTLEVVAKAVQEKKAILIDVREKSEWDKGHLKNARLIPLSALQKELSAEEVRQLVPENTVIYCHCASGYRCLEAAPLLRKYGYQVKALAPGYKDLLKAGFAPAPAEKAGDKSQSTSATPQ